jgi:tetratricopeptide (TPR) repeat protein
VSRMAFAVALLLLPLLGEAAAKDQDGAKAGQAPLARYLERGQFSEGIAWLVSFGDGSVEQQRYRGLYHHGLFQADATLAALLPIYRSTPADDTVALAVAEACLWKKDYKTATTVLGALRAPESPEALRVRALLFEQAGRLVEALQLYDRAIPSLRLPWGAMERRGQVLSWLKRFQDAESAYDAVIASREASLPQRQRCRVRKAELAAWRKDFVGARSQLESLLHDNPRQVDALMLKGQILEWEGRYPDAKRTYSDVLAIDGSHAEARLRLNKLLWVK